MTLTLPEGVGRCPRCKGAVTFTAPASTASPDKEAWTDGWSGRDDDWVRCPRCEATMTAAEMKTGKAPKAAACGIRMRPLPCRMPSRCRPPSGNTRARARGARGEPRAARVRSTNHARRDDSPRSRHRGRGKNLQRWGPCSRIPSQDIRDSDQGFSDRGAARADASPPRRRVARARRSSTWKSSCGRSQCAVALRALVPGRLPREIAPTLPRRQATGAAHALTPFRGRRGRARRHALRRIG